MKTKENKAIEVKTPKVRVYGTKQEVQTGKAARTFAVYDNEHRAGLGWRPGTSGDTIHKIIKTAKAGISEKDIQAKFEELIKANKVKSDNPKARVKRILATGVSRGIIRKEDNGLYHSK